MKRNWQFLLAGIVMLACTASAQTANFSKWQGVWTADLDGQPGVILTLTDDSAGQIGGTVVFNMVSREGGQPHVAGNSIHLLQHLQPAGDTLAFDVLRRSDHAQLHFTLQLDGDTKARLGCDGCGDAPHLTELIRSMPTLAGPPNVH